MTGVSFSPDVKYLITAGMSGEIRIFRNWNREGVEQDVTMIPGIDQLRRIEFLPGGNAFVTASMVRADNGLDPEFAAVSHTTVAGEAFRYR
jgi:hypothetical protein